MGEKVVALSGAPIYVGVPDPEVVALLEKTLEKARSGEIVAVGMGTVYRDGGTASDACGTFMATSMAGALEQLKHTLFANDRERQQPI